MLIHELAKQTGLATKTIRYYESIGLVPPSPRTENNYRAYTSGDADRLRFIAATRSLGFSLNDIAEFMVALNDDLLLCQPALDSLDQHLVKIDRRIADLLAPCETLHHIRREGEALPVTTRDEQCVCYLLTDNRKNGQVTIQREEKLNV